MNNFLDSLNNIIITYNDYIGGYLLLALLLPTGIYFTFKLKFLHIARFRHSFAVVSGKYSKKGDSGDINHFKALTTALSATVGTGNIVGSCVGYLPWRSGSDFLDVDHRIFRDDAETGRMYPGI
jgi:alanine or glycine:cation symporter, AGCS family